MVNSLATFEIAIGADVSEARQGLDDIARASNSFAASISRAFEDVAFRGKSLSDVIRTIALDLSRASLRSALKPLESGIASAFTGVGPSLGGILGDGLKAIGLAKGGVLTSPVLAALSGPRLGVMGEAGPEAVLPLARGRDGRLGVRAEVGAPPVSITFNVTAHDAASFARSEAQITAMLARAVGRGRRGL
jgi:phage-related minor tail protein